MDEELKAMLEAAHSQGASDDDLKKLIDLYEADKAQQSSGGADMGFTNGSNEPQQQSTTTTSEEESKPSKTDGTESIFKVSEEPIDLPTPTEQEKEAGVTVKPKVEKKGTTLQSLIQQEVEKIPEEERLSLKELEESDKRLKENVNQLQAQGAMPQVSPTEQNLLDRGYSIKKIDDAIAKRFPALADDKSFTSAIKEQGANNIEFLERVADPYGLTDEEALEISANHLINRANTLAAEIQTAAERGEEIDYGSPRISDNSKTVLEYMNTVEKYDNLMNQNKPLIDKIEEKRKEVERLTKGEDTTPSIALLSVSKMIPGAFAQDLSSRLLNGLENMSTYLLMSPASLASMMEEASDWLSGEEDKYTIVDKILDFSERELESPLTVSERQFYQDGNIDFPAALLQAADQVGTFAALALGNYASNLRAVNTLRTTRGLEAARKGIDLVQKQQNISTVVGGYVASLESNRREAKEMGLSGAELVAYTNFMSFLEGATELIMPDNKILSPDVKDIALKTFIANLSKGKRFATREAVKSIGEVVPKEVLEELLVLAGKTLQTSALALENEDIDVYIPELEEVINTVASISVLSSGGGVVGAIGTRTKLQNQAILKGSENIEMTKNIVQQYVDKGIVSAKDANAFLAQVEIAKVAKSEIPTNFSDEEAADVLTEAEQLTSLREEAKTKQGVAKEQINEEIKRLEEVIRKKSEERKVESTTVEAQAPQVEENQAIEEQATQEVDEYITNLTTKTEEEVFGDKTVVDGVLDKMNNAEYINDTEIDQSIEAVFNEIDRVNALNISDKAKNSITDKLYNIAEQLDNYEFRTKTITSEVTTEKPTKSGQETKREIPQKKTKASVNGINSEVTFLGGGKVSIVQTSQSGTKSSKTTTVTFPENFLYTDENGDFSAVEMVTEDGQTVTITDPEVGIPLAVNNLIAETAAVPTEVVTELVTEEVNYIKEGKDAVQEQTTDEVPVQPETETGKEVQEGKPESRPEEVAEEGQEETQEVTPQQYVEELNKTKESDPETYWTVDSVSEKDASEGTIVGDKDGYGVVSKDGDIKGVFKTLTSKAKNVADKILQAAVKAGGIKLDNFDNYLSKIYKRNGFRVVSRIPFNEKYAPDGWNKQKHGTPDVVAMVYDPEGKLDIEERTFDDYDEAIAYRDSFVEQAKALQEKAPQTAVDKFRNRFGAVVPARIQKAVDRALKSLAKIAPDLEIIIASTPEEFAILGGDRGAFAGGKIYINPQKANARTVAHEVFHALLFRDGKTEAEAKRITDRMMKSIRKTASPELLKQLDDFSAMYDDALQSEESIAELFGIIAEAYGNMDGKSKNTVRRWLNGLIKALGLDKLVGDMVNQSDKEVLEFLNSVAKKVALGEEITQADTSILRGEVSGVISSTPTVRKSVLVNFDLKRFPVNPNTTVRENVPIAEFESKVGNLLESDRMTGAYIEDAEGNPAYKFFGGVYFPVITGKWWASRTLSKARSIAEGMNSNRDKDGYIYGTPIIMSPNSHMSNHDMFETVWEFMKHDLRSPSSKVTKSLFHQYVSKALSLKSINLTEGDIKINKTDSIDTMISKLNEVLLGEDVTLSFDKRRAFIKAILGDGKVKEERKFPTAGTISEIAIKFEEEETKKAKKLWDIVMVMRTKGKLSAKVTEKSDEFYHKSYPAEISSDKEVEVFFLDGAYNITDIYPTLKKSNGDYFNWEEYSKKFSSEAFALSQYGRTAKLAKASGAISVERRQKVEKVQDETNFVPVSFWVESLKGNVDYLDNVIEHILKAREILKSGKVPQRMTTKSYLITLASMGSGGGYYENWKTKTKQTVDDVFIEKQNGRDWLRPEGAAAAFLSTDKGETLVDKINKGTATKEEIKEIFDFVGTGRESSKADYVVSTMQSGGLKAMTDTFNSNKGSDFSELFASAIKNLKGIGEGKTGFFNQYFGVSSRGVVDARQMNAWTAGSMKLTDEQKKLKKKIESSPKLQAELLKKIEEVGLELGYPEDLAAYIAHHAIWDGIANNITRHEGEYVVTRKQKLAPNGKPSNLTDVQYETVRTKAFKDWFGDWENDPENASKVVDENGEPLVVYHGSPSVDIDIFDRSASKRVPSAIKEFGTYFATNKNLSDIYSKAPIGENYKAEIRQKLNQLNDDLMNVRTVKAYDEISKEVDRLYSLLEGRGGKVYPVFLNLRTLESFDAKEGINIEAWRNLKVNLGYKTAIGRDAMEALAGLNSFTGDRLKVDGIKAENVIDMSIGSQDKTSQAYKDAKDKYLGDVYLVFDGTKNAIKLADGSNTTFDPKNPSIRKQQPARPTIQEVLDFAKQEGISKADTRAYLKELGYTTAEINAAMPRQVRPPSARRITGQPKPKKVTVQEMSALKSQIRMEAKAAKGAVAEINRIRRSIQEQLNNLLRAGKISTKQLNSILKKLNRMNLLNPVMRERFIKYMDKVYANAEYAAKLNFASSARNKIKKRAKSKSVDAVLAQSAKLFAEVDPLLVEDIDAYNEMAEKVLSGLTSSKVGKAPRAAFNVNEVNSYAGKEVEAQNKIRLQAFKESFEEITGIDPKDMTYSEMMSLLEEPEDSNLLEAKRKQARDIAESYFKAYTGIIEQMLRGVDPFTGEALDINPRQAEVMKQFLNLDLNNFTTKELVSAVDILNNFATNLEVGGAEKILNNKKGVESAKGLKTRVKKSINFLFNKTLGRSKARYITTLPLLFEQKFGGFTEGQKVMGAMGLQKLINASNRVKKVVDNLIEGYYNEFGKTKPNGEAFNSIANNIERGVYAAMRRTVNGTEAEQKAEFDRKKKLIKDSIDKLKGGNESQKVQAQAVEASYIKLLAAAKSIEDVEAKVDPINRKAVEYWTEEFATIKPQLDEVSLSMYNTLLEDDIFYTPDTYKKIEAVEQIIDDKESSYFSINGKGVVAPGKAGQLKQVNRPKSLKDRYISLDFDTNMANAMTAGLMDVNTAPSISFIKGFMGTKEAKTLFGTQEDYELFTERINDYIQGVRGRKRFDSDRELGRMLSIAGKIGTAKALGGLTQPLKQVLPVVTNTLINAGGSNFYDALELFHREKGINEMINNSGYAIANRGASARLSIENMNSQVDKMISKTTKGTDLLGSISEKILEKFLVEPDVAIARASWLAYYIQNLKKQGVDTAKINWSDHKMNDTAAEYAQGMVDRQQNISDEQLQGKLFTSPSNATRLVKNVAFPFMTFILNQKERMYSDISVILSKTASKEDKAIALRSAFGMLAELATYSAIRYTLSLALFEAAAAIIGYDEPEEEEKIRKEYLRRGIVTNFASDIFSPMPPVTDPVLMGMINTVAGFTDEGDVVFEPRAKGIAEGFGSYGIGLTRLLEVYEVLDMAYDGKYTKESFGRDFEVTLTNKQKDGARIGAALQLAHLMGMPTEFNTVGKNITKIVKKDAAKYSKKKDKDKKNQFIKKRSSNKFVRKR